MASVNIDKNTVTIEIVNKKEPETYDLKRFYTLEYLRFCELDDSTDIFVNLPPQRGGGQSLEQLTVPYRYFAYVMGNHKYVPEMIKNTNILRFPLKPSLGGTYDYFPA